MLEINPKEVYTTQEAQDFLKVSKNVYNKGTRLEMIEK